MSINSLLLYGSHARSDNTESSDIDLFAISDEPNYQMIVQGKTNIACYPEMLAYERSQNGDLFILHICSEAKPIYDPENKLETLREKFKYKDNYKTEKTQASDLGWFLVDNWRQIKNYALINKRIAWCVRTILIASSAEQRTPIFSSAELSLFSKKNYTKILIDSKNSQARNPEIVDHLSNFLSEIGSKRPSNITSKKIEEYANYFLKTKNIMGTKTIYATTGSQHDGYV